MLFERGTSVDANSYYAPRYSVIRCPASRVAMCKMGNTGRRGGRMYEYFRKVLGNPTYYTNILYQYIINNNSSQTCVNVYYTRQGYSVSSTENLTCHWCGRRTRSTCLHGSATGFLRYTYMHFPMRVGGKEVGCGVWTLCAVP